MEQTLPVLPRIDRLDRLLQLLEEKHSKSTRFGSTTSNNGDNDDDEHEYNHRENCKTLLSALDDVYHKGTLIDRLAMLENRVLQLMEDRSISRSSSSTAYATREEKELPVDNYATKSIGKRRRRSKPELLRHIAMRLADYHRALHTKNKTRVLQHPSISGGPLRRSGCRSQSSRSTYSSGRSVRHCNSDDWSDWDPNVTFALTALYLAKLVSSHELDQIGEHFKEAKTRIGVKMFLDLHLVADQARYVHDTLANRPDNRGKRPVV